MQQPGVGTGIILQNNEGKILLGLRKGKHGPRTWGCPGGGLEFNEDLKESAAREVKEETAIAVTDLEFLTITNDRFKEEGIHNITIWFSASTNQEPKLQEPNKCERWEWFDKNNLPSPLFLPDQNLLETGLLNNL